MNSSLKLAFPIVASCPKIRIEGVQKSRGYSNHGPIEADETLLDNIDQVLADYEHRLPPNCETVRLIKSGAQLELISEAAEAEGLHDLVAVLFEAEQEKFLTDRKPAGHN